MRLMETSVGGGSFFGLSDDVGVGELGVDATERERGGDD